MAIEVSIERTKNPKQKPSENDLGFGRYFSDHLFMVDYSEKSWRSPRVVPYQNFYFDPGAAVLHYGQALFEGMKAFRGADGKIRLFRPEMNWKRLQSGAERLCMKAPDWELFFEGIKAFVKTDLDWVPHGSTNSLYLRPTLVATEAFLGVRPAEQYLFYVMGSPVGAYYSQREQGALAVKIWVETKDSRCAPGGIGDVKAGGNYASSLRAAVASRQQGYSQVLWLDAGEKRYVEEVGTMNVFFRIADKVITPPLSGTILPGVTRDSTIQLLKKLNVTVEERKISLNEILDAHKNKTLQEVFGSGTAASISPVAELGMKDQTILINDGKVGPLAQQLFETVTNIQYGRIPDPYGWTVIL